MRNLGPVRRLISGSLGEPGQRTFYLEVHTESIEWFVLEKQQVAALAERALDLASEHGVSPDGTVRHVSDDAEPTFRIGDLAVGVVDDQVAVVVHPTDTELESVGFSVSLEELASMAVSALADVASGRLPCPMCSLPMDPSGHVCPASNGDLRAERR